MPAKNNLLLILACLASHFAFSQISDEELKRMTSPNYEEENEILAVGSLGILHGGGGLIGGDLEVLVTKHFGIQGGLGLVSHGAGLNYHPKGGPRSSFYSFSYWHQGGLDENHVQSLVGPSFNFRGKKWFTCQIGLGYQVELGEYAKNNLNPDDLPPVQLLYSIGAYFLMN